MSSEIDPRYPESTFEAVPPGSPPPLGVRRLQVILIKPSKYDDDGYVMRYLRGVLPSNTLATLAGLTREVAEQRSLGSIEIGVTLLDEHVQRVDPARLARKHRARGTRVVVALCGVQTNQFPRAADLAVQFRSLGLPVMVGGFHVSGAIAMSASGMPEECGALLERGVTLVKGEVEDCWAELLRDALHDRLRPYYEVAEPPDLSSAAIPLSDKKLMRRFADRKAGTVDTSRGCPFNCSYCTIINVQGHTMRSRPASRIRELVLRNHTKKINYYFFTDDNFSRNPNWEEIFDTLIELRQARGIKIAFMMQIDVPSFRIKNFVEKAAEAGCTQVFIGVESLNPKNLIASGKRQNRVGEYREMTDAWHERGIACHAGYIIGFPFDTVESVRDDVHALREHAGLDQASFFMLVPMPGSRDHAEMVRRGDWIDEDYNRFDSFHPTTDHPLMTADEWAGVYRESWDFFYSVEGMKSILSRYSSRAYWNLLMNFLWFRYAIMVEDTHPMICGFFRMKDRKLRRPGHAPESAWAHLKMRTAEVAHWTRAVTRLYFEMQEVWLATRPGPRLALDVDDLRSRYEEMSARVRKKTSRARRTLLQRGSRLLLRLDPFRVRVRSRSHLDEFWKRTYGKLRRGRFLGINPWMLGFNLARDLRLCMRFNLEFLSGVSR